MQKVFFRLCGCLALVIGLTFGAAHAAPATTPNTAGDEFWSDEFFVGGPNNTVTMLGWYQDELIVGGDFRTAGKAVTNHLAKWNGAEWQNIGDPPLTPVCGYHCEMFGKSLYVSASIEYRNQLVVGGTFDRMLVSWDGTRWEFPGGGLTGSNGYMSAMGSVATLAVMRNDLFVGGSFYNPGTGELTQLLRWDGTNWSDVNRSRSGSLGAYVTALVAHGDDLYVAGNFSDFGGIQARSIAKWNRVTNQWSALGDNSADMNDIRHMIWYDSKLIIASNTRIQAWDGTQWSDLVETASVKGQIFDLAVHNNELYVVGALEEVNGVAVNNIAIWNGTTWRGMDEPIHGAVNAISFQDDSMYIGGAFDGVGELHTFYMAKWDGTQWHSLHTPSAQGIVGDVYAMARDGTDVFVGGDFSWVGEKRANGLAKWETLTHTWTPLGNADCADDACRARVYALTHDGKALYVGGEFTEIGSTPAKNLAKWNGQSWAAVGDWERCCLRAIAIRNEQVYVGGTFDKLYQFDGQRWTKIRKFIAYWGGARVNALTIFGNDLFVGGNFAVEIWDGVTWRKDEKGFGEVSAFFVSREKLYAAVPNGVGEWRNNQWVKRGGESFETLDVSAAQGKIYLGGDSDLYTASRGIAERKGGQWQPLGSGIAWNEKNPFSWGGVARRVITVNQQIIIGGRFDIVGGKPASNFAVWNNPAPLRPKLLQPANNSAVTSQQPTLKWRAADGATAYQVQLRDGNRRGQVVMDTVVNVTKTQTPALEKGHTYLWRVRACNADWCSAWTTWWRFSLR